MSYTLSSLVLCDVTPCDTLTKAEKSTSPHHWCCYVWTDPSVTGPGEGHLLVPGIVELPSTWGSSMNDSHFNRFQDMSTVNWLSTHFSRSNILPYFALEHIYQTMQKHDSGSMSFLKASLTGGRRLSGDDCRPSRAHMPRRGRQSGGTEPDRVGQNPRAQTRDISRHLETTVTDCSQALLLSNRKKATWPTQPFDLSSQISWASWTKSKFSTIIVVAKDRQPNFSIQRSRIDPVEGLSVLALSSVSILQLFHSFPYCTGLHVFYMFSTYVFSVLHSWNLRFPPWWIAPWWPPWFGPWGCHIQCSSPGARLSSHLMSSDSEVIVWVPGYLGTSKLCEIKWNS